MSLAVIGAGLLIALILMIWRGYGGAISVGIIALLLGFVIARSGGPLGTFAGTIVSGMQSGGGFVVGLFS